MHNSTLTVGAGGSALISRTGENISFRAGPGEMITIRVRSSLVGGRFTIIESTAEPMSSPPMHYHREEEVFEILEGILTFDCDGKHFEAEPGTIVVVPAGSHHSWINLTTETVKMRVTFSPGGIEEAIFPFIANSSLADLGKLAARHGTFIVGPPLSR